MLTVFLLLIKKLVMKLLTNMAQATVSRVVPQNPLLWLQYYCCPLRSGCIKMSTSSLRTYFYILIISHALGLRTVIEDEGLPPRKILPPSIT